MYSIYDVLTVGLFSGGSFFLSTKYLSLILNEKINYQIAVVLITGLSTCYGINCVLKGNHVRVFDYLKVGLFNLLSKLSTNKSLKDE